MLEWMEIGLFHLKQSRTCSVAGTDADGCSHGSHGGFPNLERSEIVIVTDAGTD